MGKCATGKSKMVRGFAYGGMTGEEYNALQPKDTSGLVNGVAAVPNGVRGRTDSYDANGNNMALTNTMRANPTAFGAREPGVAGVNPYDLGAGMTTGLSGAAHFSSTDASNVTPQPGQAIAQTSGQPVQPAQPGVTSRRDSSAIGKLDQDIAMGTAMGELSNTERYQLANPDNQPYTIGGKAGRGMSSASAGSSADASQNAQRVSIMSSLRDKLAAQPLYAGYADGGIIGAIKNRNAQIAAAAGEGEPAPQIAAPAPQESDIDPDMAARIAANKAKLLAPKKKGLFGFANGGKIQGPGTPTSDSIQAQVKETGEPIAVSTGERIVSKAQDALLQKIAQGMGYDSLDALLEQGTGKPVGPTMQGGMAHAATGLSVAEMEAKRKPWLADGVNAIGSGIDAIQSLASGIANGPSRTPEQSAGPAGNAGRGMVNPTAVQPAIAPLQPGAPLSGSQVSPEAQVTRGLSAQADPRFTANDQQVANLSGAVQGKSSVDARQLHAPEGGGYITKADGQAVYLPPQAAPARSPGAQIDANGNDMSRTNQMKSELATMQRDRLMRDMGADITSPGTRFAAQQQLAQMDKADGMALLAKRGEREDATAGLDQQLKGQQIAQGTAMNALQQKVIEGDPAAIESWNRIHPRAPDPIVSVPDGEEETANGNVIRRPNRVVTAKTFAESQRPAAATITEHPEAQKIRSAYKKGTMTKEAANAALAKLEGGK